MKADIAWIEKAVMCEGAFLLFSSSSATRYVRMAKQLAEDSALKDHLACGAISIEELINRARKLHTVIASKDQRDIEEIELAIIMAILSETASDQAFDLLADFSLYDRNSLAWISAAARNLFQQLAKNLVDASIPDAQRVPIADMFGADGSADSPENEMEYGVPRFDFANVNLVAEVDQG